MFFLFYRDTGLFSIFTAIIVHCRYTFTYRSRYSIEFENLVYALFYADISARKISKYMSRRLRGFERAIEDFLENRLFRAESYQTTIYFDTTGYYRAFSSL